MTTSIAPHQPTTTLPTGNVGARLDAVDVVRGIIMIIMALDHTRDYFTNPAIDPTNIATTSTALFLTRWITHLCAPVFFLLTGTAAYLSGRSATSRAISRRAGSG